ADATAGDFHGSGTREDAMDRGADPEYPGLREQAGLGPFVAAAGQDPAREEALRARRDRLDHGVAIFLYARVRGGRDDAVVHALPRRIEGDLPPHRRAAG